MKYLVRIPINAVINLMVVLSSFSSLWEKILDPRDNSQSGGVSQTMFSIIILLTLPLIVLAITSSVNKLMNKYSWDDWTEQEVWDCLHIGNLCAALVAFLIYFYPKEGIQRIELSLSELTHSLIVLEFFVILILGYLSQWHIESFEDAGRYCIRITINAIVTYLSMYYTVIVATLMLGFIPILGIVLIFVVPVFLIYWWVYSMNTWLEMTNWAKVEEKHGESCLQIGAVLAALAAFLHTIKTEHINREHFIVLLPIFTTMTFVCSLGLVVAIIIYRIHRQEEQEIENVTIPDYLTKNPDKP